MYLSKHFPQQSTKVLLSLWMSLTRPHLMADAPEMKFLWELTSTYTSIVKLKSYYLQLIIKGKINFKQNINKILNYPQNFIIGKLFVLLQN